MTEKKYRLSDKADENGCHFVLAPDGNIAFGIITPDTGLTVAPIYLSEGMITNQKTKEGYGLLHIEARHGAEILGAGYSSVIEFVAEVSRCYEIIREGKKRKGNQTYILILTDTHNNTLMIELSGDGSYWNINTAGVFKTSYGANKKEVYNRHTTAKQLAETVKESLREEQCGTTSQTRMNSLTTSVCKVIKRS